MTKPDPRDVLGALAVCLYDLVEGGAPSKHELEKLPEGWRLLVRRLAARIPPTPMED